MIPLRGQGKLLPPDCPYTGQWILEDRLFLYRPTNRQPQTLELTAGFRRADGEWCLGFNAMTLATQLGVGSEEIFEHNRTQTLILEGVAPAAPQGGGVAAKIYIFHIGDDRRAALLVETGPEGSA
jgi:hypothetical protein